MLPTEKDEEMMMEENSSSDDAAAVVGATTTASSTTKKTLTGLEEGGENSNTEKKMMTYKQRAKQQNGMNYTVTDVPPFGTSMLLGLQHYLTMLGATVLIPLIVCPAMGATSNQTAQVISSIFFVSGINTVRKKKTRKTSVCFLVGISCGCVCVCVCLCLCVLFDSHTLPNPTPPSFFFE